MKTKLELTEVNGPEIFVSAITAANVIKYLCNNKLII